MARIDDEHFPEFGRQVAAFAQEIDKIADRQMLGHRDEFAAHQTPGGLLGIGQRALDRGAVLRVEFGQDRLLVLGIEVLDHGDGVVGLELLGDVGDDVGRQFLDQQLAYVVVELGDDLDAHQVADRARQLEPLVLVGQLEQVGYVGGMQRFDQLVDRVVVLVAQRVAHLADIFGPQTVILVVNVVFARGVLGGGGGLFRQILIELLGRHRPQGLGR